MRGFADKGGAYPISVIPKGSGKFEVKNLETDESLGEYDSPSEAGDVQERERQKIHAHHVAGTQA